MQKLLTLALVCAALPLAAQIKNPIGTLQPKHQTPPVVALFVGDTSSTTEARAPFDTVLKATGSRFVCAKEGIGYTIRKENKSANRKTTAVYVDTIVRPCFAKGTVIPTLPTIPGDSPGAQSRKAPVCDRSKPCKDTVSAPVPARKPPR